MRVAFCAVAAAVLLLYARHRRRNDVTQLLTIIVVTSPSRSCPSTRLLQRVFASFALVPGLQECRKISVADGFTISERRSHKRGAILAEEQAQYLEYIERVGELTRSHSDFQHCDLLALPSRHGFGWAVREALARVRTRFVLVVQHDRAFLRAVDLPQLLDALQRDARVKYILLPSKGTAHYQQTAEQAQGALQSLRCSELQLLQLNQWYDSTHLTSAAHYEECVFGSGLVRRGDFFESGAFGAALKADVHARGAAAHAAYGTWLLQEPGPPRRGFAGPGPTRDVVGHLDARSAWSRWAEDGTGGEGRAPDAREREELREVRADAKERKKAARRAAQERAQVKASLRGVPVSPAAAQARGLGGYYRQIAGLPAS